jgi:thiol-disulfide isomerase/thioredoxin
MAFTFVFGLVVLAVSARADEKFPLLKAGGTTYTNVTVTGVSATDIYFTYDQGMANAKLKDLDPALQKHFSYDPAKAGAVEKKQAADQAQYHQQLLRQPPPEDMSRTAGSDASNGGKKIWAKSFLNQKFPGLAVEKWLTAPPDLRGKFVLVDFWATWCPPCRKAIPELNAFQKKFADKLVVIGLSDESEAAVRRLTDPKIEYTIAIDSNAVTKNMIGVTGIPHVMIMDPQGYVRWEGFPFLEGHELTEQVVAGIIDRYSAK